MWHLAVEVLESMGVNNHSTGMRQCGMETLCTWNPYSPRVHGVMLWQWCGGELLGLRAILAQDDRDQEKNGDLILHEKRDKIGTESIIDFCTVENKRLFKNKF